MGATTLEREVGKALRSTSLVLKRGPSVAIRIGKALGSPDQLYANALAAISGVSAFFQQNHRWKNTITTIHIQATNTPALPVYLHPKYAEAAEYYRNTKPPSSDAKAKGKGMKEKQQKEEQAAADAPNKVGDTRKIKRGGIEKAGKPNGEKSVKKSFKEHKHKAVKPKKQK